mmetsp:Transcript_3442/g.4685  ORF Transcript_3442/g.4685 Transcript_3442/m.4685 type:complete len:100 (-) Transcript_3442:869-1168(-)
MAKSGGSELKLTPEKFGKQDKAHQVSGENSNGTSIKGAVSSSNGSPNDMKGPREGVPLNQKASGGTVRTWMPSSKTERYRSRRYIFHTRSFHMLHSGTN